MSQKDLFGNIVSEEVEVIKVAAYSRKKKLVKKKVRTPSKIVSSSPINKDSLSKQSNMLIKYLVYNENATFLDAIRIYIGTPHSRFAEISKWMIMNKMVLHREMGSISNGVGDMIRCNKYWINEVDKPVVKLLLGL